MTEMSVPLDRRTIPTPELAECFLFSSELAEGFLVYTFDYHPILSFNSRPQSDILEINLQNTRIFYGNVSQEAETEFISESIFIVDPLHKLFLRFLSNLNEQKMDFICLIQCKSS